jgi:hypothetical protein
MMAYSDSTHFPCFDNIQAESSFVHQAMEKLGFACAFCELALADMQLALALALHLKRSQTMAEVWES